MTTVHLTALCGVLAVPFAIAGVSRLVVRAVRYLARHFAYVWVLGRKVR